MNFIRITSLAAALALTVGSANAIPFDSSSGAPVVATLGPAGDYTTLADAAFAFSSVAGGINRPWTLEVQADITETSTGGAFLGNTFANDGSLTIKPAAATQPTITFTNAAAPLGIFGHLVIGFKFDQATVTSATSCESNGRFTIDGSNTPGGTTRDLTIRLDPAVNSGGNRIIRIWGNNDGVVIKNTKVQMTGVDTSTCEVVAIAMGTYTGDTTPLTPDNTVIDNCEIIASTAGTSSYAISASTAANGTLPAGNAAQGTIIRNCDLVGKQRGIFANGFGSTTVEDNRISLTSGTGVTVTYVPIFFFTSNSNTGWTVNVDSNVVGPVFCPTTSAAQGPYGMLVDTGMVTGTVNIKNNILKDLRYAPAAANDFLVRGISCGDANTAFNVEHNSIDWSTTASTGVTGNRVAGIVFPLARGNAAATVANNIVKFSATGTSSTVVGISTTASLTFAGNNLVKGSSALTGYASTAVASYPNLADWQALGFDSGASGGQSVDPAGTTPAWDSNLHFASKPIAGLATVASSTILTDVDGNPRPATNAVPGADEPAAAGVHDWQMIY